MNLLVFILGVTFFLCCLASELVYLITQTIRLVILIRTLKNSKIKNRFNSFWKKFSGF